MIIAALLLAPTLTFSDMLRHMHDDYRALHGYQEEISEYYSGTWTGRRAIRLIDGQRSSMSLVYNGQAYAESFFNGKTFWSVDYPDKSYTQSEGRNLEFLKLFNPPKDDAQDPVNFVVTTAYDLNIKLSYAHVTTTGTATLDDKRVRTVQVVGGATASANNIYANFYFEPDAYILRRAEYDYADEKGIPFVLLVTVKAQHGVKFKDSDFSVDPEKIKGFTRKLF